MRYLKLVLYPLMTGALGFVAISVPFAYALQNALIPLKSEGAERAVLSPGWLYYDGTMLIWLIGFILALFAHTICKHATSRQLLLFAPVYAPLCYAVALLLLIHFNLL